MNARLDYLDQKISESFKFDITDRLDSFNKVFKTSLLPEKNFFGVTETIKDNGVLERISRKADGTAFKEYYRDGKIFQSRESLKGQVSTVKYDDNGTAYLKETTTKDAAGMLRNRYTQLAANVEIKKGNFSAKTDSLGRSVSNKVTDIKLSPERESLSPKLKTVEYRPGDQRGHIIADLFGGPASQENIVAQTSEANMSKMKQVENIVKGYVENGDKVDYEVKTNYIGNDTRPSSFEPKITVNGQVIELPSDLRKIYNNDFSETGKAGKFVNNAKEVITETAVKGIPHHRAGLEMGMEAAKMTMAVSTVQNTVDFVQGEITAEELVSNVAKDTGTAAVVGYGTGFISSAVSTAMQQSSHQLIQSVGKSGVPAAVVSFGVMSYDSVIDFAKGEITGQELAYDLGENAVSFAGGAVGIMGAAKVGAALGSVVPGAGTAVGFSIGLVGSMVGCAVASEAYVTAVEAGSKGADVLIEKASDLATDAYETARIEIPTSAENIRNALNDFASYNGLPFSIG